MSIAFVCSLSLETIVLGTALTLAPVEEKQSPLPAVLATIHDRPVTLTDYQDWLVEVQGAALLEQYFDELVLLRAAADRGCSVPDAEVEAAFETEWNTVVKLRFKGDETGFLQELAGAGHNKNTYRVARCHSIRTEMTLERLSSLERDVSEGVLRQRFATEYGTPAEQISVSLIRINKYAFEQARALKGEAKAKSAAEIDANATAHAKALLDRITKGEDFAEIARQNSNDPSGPTGGRIEHISAESHGAALADAARALKLNQPVSGLIQEPMGYAILRLEGRKPIEFEASREALIAQIRSQPVDAATRAATLAKLRTDYPIDRKFKP